MSFNIESFVNDYRADFESTFAGTDETDDTKKVWLIEHGVPFGKVPAVWKLLGGSKGRKAGFTQDFYGWLKEGVRTMEEVEEFCKENGSQNVIRQIRHYQGVAELTNSIHNQ